MLLKIEMRIVYTLMEKKIFLNSFIIFLALAMKA